MSNRSKQQGTAWESAIVRRFTDEGINAWRLSEGGQYDLGDVMLDEYGIVIECKDTTQLNLHQAVAKANRKAARRGHIAAGAWKRKKRQNGNQRRTQVGPPIVAMLLDDYLLLLHHLPHGITWRDVS